MPLKSHIVRHKPSVRSRLCAPQNYFQSVPASHLVSSPPGKPTPSATKNIDRQLLLDTLCVSFRRIVYIVFIFWMHFVAAIQLRSISHFLAGMRWAGLVDGKWCFVWMANKSEAEANESLAVGWSQWKAIKYYKWGTQCEALCGLFDKIVHCSCPQRAIDRGKVSVTKPKLD